MTSALITVAPKLEKLIPLLGSDKDGEVVATTRAIGGTLAQAGPDLHDLAKLLGRVGPPDPVEPVCWRHITPSERTAWLAEMRAGHAGCEQWRLIEVVRSGRLWKEKGHRRFLYSAPSVRANDCPDRDNERRSAAVLGIWKSGTQAGGSLVEWGRAESPFPANDTGKPTASPNEEAR